VHVKKEEMKKKLKPESLMMSYGYKPEWSEGAIKLPIFQTSTFSFKKAEDGKAFFELAYGLREKKPKEQEGLIYSRLNNPDLEILEERLTLWDEAEGCAVFESGMSAIATVFLEILKPGDTLLYSNPVYGGTDHFINHFLPTNNIKAIPFDTNTEKKELEEKIKNTQPKIIYIETPANPTNALIDIEMCVKASGGVLKKDKPLIVVDNTYVGPLWQHPLKLGADIVVYSATKYIGGHSDVIAGACLASKEIIKRIKGLRTFLGNMASPWTGWLLLRSLETLKVRMEKQALNAQKIAEKIKDHKKIKKVHYLGLLKKNSKQYKIYKKQQTSPGAMLSLELKGGEKQAFSFLNNLKLIKLAVSLGSTESLAQHPATMTHADVCPQKKQELGIKENLVRVSVGIENPEDLIWDITQALNKV